MSLGSEPEAQPGDAAPSEVALEPSSVVDPERPLPLEALDRALAPIRRVASWASADPAARIASVRYLEAIGRRWLGVALRLDLPLAVRDQLATLAGLFEGFDEAALDERRRRIVAIDQLVGRLDAQLGLPLPVRVVARPQPVPITAQLRPEAEEEAPAPVGERRAKIAPERTPEERPEPAPERPPEPAVAPGEWDGDLWASLSDLPLAPALVEALADEDIVTAGQLLRLRPVAEEALAPVHGAGREMPEGRVAVGGRVGARYTVIDPRGGRTHHLRLRGADMLRARFSAPPSWEQGTDAWLEGFVPDQRVVVVGTLQKDLPGSDGADRWVLIDPELAADDGQHVVRVQSYGLERVPDRAVRAAIQRLLGPGDTAGTRVRDFVPAHVLARVVTSRPPAPTSRSAADARPGTTAEEAGRGEARGGLPALGVALAEVHRRGSGRPEARARLAFDELLATQVALSCRRFSSSRDRGIPHPVLHGMVTRLGGDQDFVLDDDQQLAFEEIKRDLRQAVPMLRVVVGDVGTGKGALALATAVMVAESRSQVLWVAPDRASAEQRFTFAEGILREAGLVARLVEDANKRAVRDAIGRGEVHVVFGPLELLGEGLEFRRLGLVVAEERAPWGQASALLRQLRPPRPHALIVPTTPVGATVALTAYADHDLTVLGGRFASQPEAPPRRARSPEGAARGELARGEREDLDFVPLVAPVPRARTVEVGVVPASERDQAYAAAAEAVAEGRQVVLVFPMVDQADALTLREAMRVVRALEEEALQGARIGLYHGAMTREERHRVYEDFRHRRCDVLVATVLVEDGPTVPDVSLVVVEQADRVDMGRLQRIRGFVSRSRHDARLMLVVGEMSDADAADRLGTLVATADNFALHDAWVSRRPIEQVVVDAGAPLPSFVWADPAQDRELVWYAREVVHELLRADPTLRRGWSLELAREARSRFDDLWPSDEGEGTSWRCPIPDGAGGDRKKRRRRRRKR